jgi:hypothetical protein
MRRLNKDLLNSNGIHFVYSVLSSAGLKTFGQSVSDNRFRIIELSPVEYLA